MVLEKTLESPLDYKEIQPVHSEGDQPWDFFGGNDAKAEVIPRAKIQGNLPRAEKDPKPTRRKAGSVCLEG